MPRHLTTNDLVNVANASHTHSIGEVSGLQSALDAKQATLVSGNNIATINGQSLLAGGDISISGGDTYTAANGLTLNGTTFELGGTISKATALTLGSNTFSMNTQKNYMGPYGDMFMYRSYFDIDGTQVKFRMTDTMTTASFGLAPESASIMGPYAYINGGGSAKIEVTQNLNIISGTTRIVALAGTGSRMVVADANGNLSTQTIPSGGSGSSYTFNNGVFDNGTTVGLGGSLAGNTVIGLNNYEFKYTGLSSQVRMTPFGGLAVGDSGSANYNAASAASYQLYVAGAARFGNPDNYYIDINAGGGEISVQGTNVASMLLQGNQTAKVILDSDLDGASVTYITSTDGSEVVHAASANIPVYFKTNGANRLKIDSNGLLVNALAGSGTRIVVVDANGQLSTQAGADGNWATSGNNIYSANSGNVMIGTSTDSGHKFQVNGTVKLGVLGTGATKMVVADSDGVLSTQDIPSGSGGSSTAAYDKLAKGQFAGFYSNGTNTTWGYAGYVNAAPTVAGSQSSYNVSMGSNYRARLFKATKFATAAATNSNAGVAYGPQLTVVTHSNSGRDMSWKLTAKFGIDTPGTGWSGGLIFASVSSSVTNSLNDGHFAIGWKSGDTNLKVHISPDGMGLAASSIDLGPNFPVNNTTTDVYYVEVWKNAGGYDANGRHTVNYSVTNLTTGATTSGSFTSGLIYGLQYPVLSCNTGTGTTAVAIAVSFLTLETTY
jgi:hypothetical protein